MRSTISGNPPPRATTLRRRPRSHRHRLVRPRGRRRSAARPTPRTTTLRESRCATDRERSRRLPDLGQGETVLGGDLGGALDEVLAHLIVGALLDFPFAED